MSPNPQETAHLVTFTEEIHHENLLFLCSGPHVVNEIMMSKDKATFSKYFHYRKHLWILNNICVTNGSRYSRMDQVKLVEDSL